VAAECDGLRVCESDCRGDGEEEEEEEEETATGVTRL
jgi:hypothetical protein